MNSIDLKRVIKECFWDMNFTQKDIENILVSDDFSQKNFLFRKILLNSSRVLSDLNLFEKQELKTMLENFRVPKFNHEYIFRRHNIAEVYFLDKPLLIDELKWVA